MLLKSSNGKKENFLCIHLPKELCPKELCHVGIGIKSSAAAGAAASSSEVFAEKIVSKQVIQIIKGKLILSATFGRCDGDADGHQHEHILRLGAPFSKGFIYS